MADPSYDVLSSAVQFAGRIITVRTDEVRMPGGSVATREVVSHPGAVGVVALDPDDRVLMIRQYRPAVRRYLWELPAGLLDVPGEDPFDTAIRELAEEVGIGAREWAVLVDVHSSPGMSDEAYRVYLARELSDKTTDFVAGPDEESDLQEEWVALPDAVARVLAGDISNGLAVAGILATAAWRAGALPLRPVDAPWVGRSART
jgi:ADP-ribose pyrophosphatase